MLTQNCSVVSYYHRFVVSPKAAVDTDVFYLERCWQLFVRLCLHGEEAYPLEHFRSGLVLKKIGRYLLNCSTEGLGSSLVRGTQSKIHFQLTVG